MQLTILGANGWPGPGGANSGYLVREEGFSVLLDCGHGVLSKLQEHVGIDAIDAIFITHAHPDHFADLYALWVAVAYGGQGEMNIPLFAPAGFMDTLVKLASDPEATSMREAFSFVAVEPGASTPAGPFDVTAFAVNHPRDAVGYRLAAGGGVLAYSGDTGPTDALEDLGRDADLFLCEATYQGPAPEEYPFHLSGEQAGAYAAAAGASKLVLTHLWPTMDASVSAAQAAQAFGGEIVVAESGMTMEVGS